jgi:CheR methyltransferase, SAM binding domain
LWPCAGLQRTDADPVVLRRAKMGCFSPSSLKDIPAHWRGLAFTPDDGRYCVRAEYRQELDFRLQDVRAEIPAGLFDLILCRNLVFTYFDVARQRDMIGRLAGILRENGYLVIGAHEELPDGGTCVQANRRLPGDFPEETPPPPTRRDALVSARIKIGAWMVVAPEHIVSGRSGLDDSRARRGVRRLRGSDST